MDHTLKEDWIMEQPSKPSFPSNLLTATRESTSAFIYRFEVTYGLYVMDFWEKMIIYALLGLCISFTLWKAIVPLCFASFRLISHHLALEPKGLYSVLERSAQQEFTGLLMGAGIQVSNSTLNGTSHGMHL
ncbi:hypothetical protein SLS56_005001 [Neofusicoccum ribis]|uniref:Uncharacterized protein n=1 Tax=Neofusicoccum ribis TaxID=45134 RepID=A0ABR3SUU1_9PEZI